MNTHSGYPNGATMSGNFCLSFFTTRIESGIRMFLNYIMYAKNIPFDAFVVLKRMLIISHAWFVIAQKRSIILFL